MTLGNSSSLSTFVLFLFKSFRCHRRFPSKWGAHAYRSTVHTHTGILGRFLWTHPLWDSCFDWQWDRPPKGVEEMFFGKPMRCGDAGVIFYSPRVPVHWYAFKEIFSPLFSLLFWGIHVFLMASMVLISSLLQALYNLSFHIFINAQGDHCGVKWENISAWRWMYVFPHLIVLSTVLCMPVCTYVCHYTFPSRFCPYATKAGELLFNVFFCCTLTDKVPSLNLCLCVFFTAGEAV